MSPPVQKRCVGGGRNGELITSALDEQACIKEEGVPTPIPDGGNRITTDLLGSYLKGPVWNAAKLSGGLTNVNDAERLVLFPLCSARRRLPASELLNLLESFNRDFAHELRQITNNDSRLRRSLLQLLLDMSSIAASALEFEESGGSTSFTFSEDFMRGVEAVARAIRSRTSHAELIAQLNRLVELAKVLTGTRLSDVVSVLGGDRSAVR